MRSSLLYRITASSAPKRWLAIEYSLDRTEKRAGIRIPDPQSEIPIMTWVRKTPGPIGASLFVNAVPAGYGPLVLLS
ncbi:MAG: hypothetical protein OXH92_16375 [Bryobacterales bacterium]|nr:hypothetical protein [Bryobacterales bacterium]